jgi:hypothetical protein
MFKPCGLDSNENEVLGRRSTAGSVLIALIDRFITALPGADGAGFTMSRCGNLVELEFNGFDGRQYSYQHSIRLTTSMSPITLVSDNVSATRRVLICCMNCAGDDVCCGRVGDVAFVASPLAAAV